VNKSLSQRDSFTSVQTQESETIDGEPKKRADSLDFRSAYMKRLQSETDKYLKSRHQKSKSVFAPSAEVKRLQELASKNASVLSSEGEPESVKDDVVDVFTTDKNDEFALQFINKSVNDIRRNYLMKLAYNKVWLLPENRPKAHQTAIIFDWDDTLLCTSFLVPTGYIDDEPIPEALQTHLQNLDSVSSTILAKAISKGKTYIITNASPGWVEHSSKKFLPTVHELLPQVKIISARGGYEALYPGNSHQWKIEAFLETQRDLEHSPITNILALGDSHIEMDAAHHLATKFATALIKTVKFRENPNPDELFKQLNLVKEKFDHICDNVKNLTIRLERKAPVKKE